MTINLKEISNIEQLPLPPGWGKDGLSQFIQKTMTNTFASFTRLRREYLVLSGIHEIFSKLKDNLNNSQDWFLVFFFGMAHSAYLGATRLALSTQLPEAYRAMRGCLENSVYGEHLHRHPNKAKVWLQRNENQPAKDRVKSEFAWGPLIRDFQSVDPDLGKLVSVIYELTIDYGGHPNVDALTSNTKMQDLPEELQFDFNYLNHDMDSLALPVCLKGTAATGLCSLRIFRTIFKERFDMLGLSNDLRQLQANATAVFESYLENVPILGKEIK